MTGMKSYTCWLLEMIAWGWTKPCGQVRLDGVRARAVYFIRIQTVTKNMWPLVFILSVGPWLTATVTVWLGSSIFKKIKKKLGKSNVNRIFCDKIRFPMLQGPHNMDQKLKFSSHSMHLYMSQILFSSKMVNVDRWIGQMWKCD